MPKSVKFQLFRDTRDQFGGARDPSSREPTEGLWWPCALDQFGGTLDHFTRELCKSALMAWHMLAHQTTLPKGLHKEPKALQHTGLVESNGKFSVRRLASMAS
jgi:hypothetical protein